MNIVIFISGLLTGDIMMLQLVKRNWPREGVTCHLSEAIARHGYFQVLIFESVPLALCEKGIRNSPKNMSSSEQTRVNS